MLLSTITGTLQPLSSLGATRIGATSSVCALIIMLCITGLHYRNYSKCCKTCIEALEAVVKHQPNSFCDRAVVTQNTYQ